MSHWRANSSQNLVVDIAETAEGAFAVDLRQSIVAWNAAAEELLGYGEQEVLGRKCASVLGICGARGADCDPPRCNAIANMMLSRPTPHIEVEVRARTGSIRRLSMSIIPTHSSSGDVRVLHLFHDMGQDPPEPRPTIFRPWSERLIHPCRRTAATKVAGKCLSS